MMDIQQGPLFSEVFITHLKFLRFYKHYRTFPNFALHKKIFFQILFQYQKKKKNLCRTNIHYILFNMQFFTSKDYCIIFYLYESCVCVCVCVYVFVVNLKKKHSHD